MDYRDDEFDDADGFLSDDSTGSEFGRNWNSVVAEIPNGAAAEAPEPTEEQNVLNMYYSIVYGHVDKVMSLLDSGLNVHVQLQDNWKPILLAASVGNNEIVHELIVRGANVNDHRDYQTVLMAACNCPETTAPFETSLLIVEELLHHGVNVNAITRKRETALMFAAGVGNVPVVRLLLSCSNLVAEDNKGWNALFWAVYNNKIETTRMLLDAGLNAQKQDVCGNNLLYYATMHENEELIKLFSLPVEENWDEPLKTVYDFEYEFRNTTSRPQFLEDIYSMLYGMKCRNIQKQFATVSLLQFLSMSEDELEDIGIQLPFQRNKILAGLYKFHKQLFKQKSIPIVPKNDVFSTIDVSHSTLTAIRQLTVMEASLLYILKCDRDFSLTENHDVKISIDNIRSELADLKRSVGALHSLAQEWDNRSNKVVDLISAKSRCSWFTCKFLVGSSITIAACWFMIKRIYFRF